MGRGKGQQLKMAAQQASQGSSTAKGPDPSEMTPKQLKQQAAGMRKLGNTALRKRVPEMRNATDAEIEQSISQLERMAEDPEFRANAQRQAQNFTPADRELARKNPDDMTPQEFHRLITLQREMLKSDPEGFWRQMENNPQTAGMSRDQIEKQINQMADMSPDELGTYMSVSKSMKPVQDAVQKFDGMTGGYGRYLIMAVVIFVSYMILRSVFGFVGGYIGYGAVPVAEDVAAGVTDPPIDDLQQEQMGSQSEEM